LLLGAKSRVFHPFAWRVASCDPEGLEAAEKILEIASVYELYEKAKTARQAVDFGDLIMLPTLLLERDGAVRAATRLRHRHLMVDEYQDVNRASVRLVKALADDGKNLWVVGDARQSIYRFRGASSANMAAFSDDFPGAVWEPLEINYRSTQKIIDAYSTFAQGMPMPADLAHLRLSGLPASASPRSTALSTGWRRSRTAIPHSMRCLIRRRFLYAAGRVMCGSSGRID
jgi:hypothetical protein